MAADTTDFAVAERRHELADDVREEHGVRIAKDEDFALGNFFKAVQHGSLARILRSLHQGDALVGKARYDFSGLVGRTVIADKHFELFFRVVDFQNIADFAFDNRFFVESRNQERHHGQFIALVHITVAPLEQFAHKRQRQRKQAVAQEQQKDERPERDLQIKHDLVVHRSIHSFSFSRN